MIFSNYEAYLRSDLIEASQNETNIERQIDIQYIQIFEHIWK